MLVLLKLPRQVMLVLKLRVVVQLHRMVRNALSIAMPDKYERQRNVSF